MTTASMITCAGCKHSYADTALFCPNCGTPKARDAAPSGDPLIGKVLGERFQVIEFIGQGASGTIYRAEHVTLRRRVAIKVLHNELSRDDLAVERFRREATTVAEIDNEHIVEIHDFGRTPDGRLYLAMELLEGETLDHVLAREKQMSVERTADILIQVGEALMEAHAIGYVHRDLRPRNVYLAVRRGKANFVKLLDFGLAKLVETDAQAASTSLGMTFGDPRYMSPEQARGDRIDRRADIYQLGCVAYEMLTGAPPFTGNRVFDILSKQVTEIPAPLPTRRPGVPLWMEAAVAKMLAKDPENRFATTTRMVEALRRGLETGEVMEDEIARRRESIPPPSVSRVMQKMGIPAPLDTPPASGPTVGGGKETIRGHAIDANPPTMPGYHPQSAPPAMPPQSAPPAMPPPLAAAAPAQPSVGVEAPRRRTGTPEVGVPVPELSPVAGQIEPRRSKEPSGPVAPIAVPPSGRARRASSSSGLSAPSDSSSWFDDGEQASREADRIRSRKSKSSSSTDLSLYDEPATRKRWPLLVGGLVVVGALAGTIAFAMSRGEDKKKPAETVAATPPPPPPVTNVPPSEIINTDTPAPPPPAETAVATKTTSAKKSTPEPTASHATTPKTTTPKTTTTTSPKTNLDPDDTAGRRPGGDWFGTTPTNTAPTNTAPTNTTPTNTTPTQAVTTPTPTGVSGAEGPLDPYGADPAAAPSDTSGPEKKADFFANLGQQRLASNDTTGAAANFMKALEIDPKNVVSTIGMGEIALRQGLFGDAIAHLKKAVKLAPKSSRVFTLLGEAYLNSGNNSVAADNFKKALQLDPENARARDGYNEASSKVPPPTDE